jgi:5,10-methylenetetrahydromethanopterin reductase
MIEFWRAGGSARTVEAIETTEADGWDGLMFMDSQSLSPDPYVLMGAGAVATKRLLLAPGVTNPLTRHVAVTAASMATLQAISGGRAVLGIGRGDSALAYLGHAPMKIAPFEQALSDLQTLLSGGKIAFGAQSALADAPPLATLSLGDRPTGAGLEWLPEGLPKVPLDVAATGPKVIEMSAPLAERITFSVGAIPERIDWALELARAARARRGLGDAGVAYGAQIIVICHPDREVRLERAASMVAPLARFQVIQGKIAGPMTNSDAENFHAISRGYDMTKHSKSMTNNKIIGASLTPEFIERFAIVGDPDACAERLIGLLRQGMERFVVVGPGVFPEPENLFTKEVIPAVRAAAR